MGHTETTSDLRRRNRSRILRRLVREGATTRRALAGEFGVSAATVTNVVKELFADGLVVESTSIPSRAGRPSSQVAVNETGAYFLGADVGERGVMVDLYDLALGLVDGAHVAVPARLAAPEEIRGALNDAIGTLRDRNRDVWARVVGLGLGLPGIVDTPEDGASMLYAQSVGWDPLPVADLLDDPEFPVLSDNGAKTYSLAELWRGSARQDALAIVVLVGRGVGAGVIDSGRIVRGQSSSAGEWGHTKVVLGGRRCSCGSRGCLESLIGGDAIAERLVEAGGKAAGSAEETLDALIAAAEAGDPRALDVLDETVEVLGVGLSNLVNMFNPAQIVIGGWAGHALITARSPQIAKIVKSMPLHHPAAEVELVGSGLGVDAVALGASLLVVQSFIDGDLG